MRVLTSLQKNAGSHGKKYGGLKKKLESNKTIWGYHAVVDHEKLHQKSYIMLIKKTNKPLGDLINTILRRDIEKNAAEMGIQIQASKYLHGAFDWVLVFTAEDIRHAKKFGEQFNRLYQSYIGETFLLEEIFPVKSCGIENPQIKKLKDFV
jgi:uncharacterized protein with GYD domain